MKRLICFLMILITVLSVASCSCNHSWKEATCITARVCTKCGEETEQPIGHKWQEATCTTFKTCSVCGKEEGAMLAHEYDRGKCTLCGKVNEDYCWSIYKAMLDEMLDFDEAFNSVKTIESYLEQLPDDYREVSDIKEELIFIKSQMEVFSNAMTNEFMREWVDQSEKSEYYVDYAKVRKAYFNLINNDDKYEKWNLTEVANFYTTNAGATMVTFVIVGSWETGDGKYYFDVIENADNSISTRTNIPSEKNSSKSYYYFINGNTIGYTQIDNEDIEFDAYRISEISENYIRVFCFKNSQTYTLYRK